MELFNTTKWEEMKTLGTAYIDGELQWCGQKYGLVYSSKYPEGTCHYAYFKRMDWQSGKDVDIAR